MAKVEIKYHVREDRDAGYTRIAGCTVIVNDRKIVAGRFGGEPEDNSFERDYSWVGDALEDMARALGADLETVTEPEED